MHAALRPYTTAGVALVGASVIAVSPVAPPLPDVQEATTRVVSNAQVALSAIDNPLAVFGPVFDQLTAFIEASVGSEIDNPARILTQLLTNQFGTAEAFATFATALGGVLGTIAQDLPTTIEDALTALSEGDLETAYVGTLVNVAFAFIPLILGGQLTPVLEVAQRPFAAAQA
ncbi:MAG: hypothetical protein ACRDU5_12090, partial [Mycobacterium sp.]